MFCKECGAEIPDNSKHCPECGAKLVDDAPVVQSKAEEKESFVQKNKKKLLVCGIGLIVIFGIVALISIGSNHTDVNKDLSSGIEKVLEDKDYKVSRSVKDGNVKLSGTYLNLTTDGKSEGDLVEVMIYPFDMLKEVSSEYDLSPRKINGIDGYGGYAHKTYNYAFVDNGNTVVIIAPSENSTVLDTIVKDY